MWFLVAWFRQGTYIELYMNIANTKENEKMFHISFTFFALCNTFSYIGNKKVTAYIGTHNLLRLYCFSVCGVIDNIFDPFLIDVERLGVFLLRVCR